MFGARTHVTVLFCYACAFALPQAEPARVLALKQRDEIETRPIRQAGDSSNRIDVVLMGDGYTEEQREKMFDDMTRLVDDMWGDITFQS